VCVSFGNKCMTNKFINLAQIIELKINVKIKLSIMIERTGLKCHSVLNELLCEKANSFNLIGIKNWQSLIKEQETDDHFIVLFSSLL
jgi:hypothetical protein